MILICNNYSADERWNLVANDTENISQVVVIPAYAEREMLFSTLASIAQNPSSSLDYSFILCVINNKNNSPFSVIKNNLQTIKYLEAVVKKKSLRKFNTDQGNISSFAYFVRCEIETGLH